MAHFNSIKTHFQIHLPGTPIPQGTQIAVSNSPKELFDKGFNILVELSTSSAFSKIPNMNRKSITVIAHFDTGASITAIDKQLALHLGLIPIGFSTVNTASGVSGTNYYSVDLSFVNSALKPLQDLRVNEVDLKGFNLANCITKPDDEKNFGLLLGRDVMSAWSVFWHGPSSSVFISD